MMKNRDINNTNFSPRFTIFIPTYNRAHLLPRALKSVENQAFRDFELIIIDDGSTDNTAEIVKRWLRKIHFPVLYYQQKNQGKPAAHNAAVNRANGELFVTLDSDDLLADNALELLDTHWKKIDNEQKPEFCGIEGLCAMLNDGSIAGDRIPKDTFDSNYPELRHRLKISGDKKNAIRTDILREYPYPIFPGEKHIRMSLIWSRMALKYKFRYINEIIQLIEYQPDGLSSSASHRRLTCPHGYRLVHQEIANDTAEYYSTRQLFKNMSKYIRYSLHCKVNLYQQKISINNKILWWIALPKGYINYLSDLRKIKRAA